MKRFITYSNLTATLALLFALGLGSAEAVRLSQGPRGPRGARGAQGPAGAEGRTGPEGQWGIRGQVGPTGAEGVRGLEGPRGERGKEGGELPWARYCTALGEVVRDLEFEDQKLKEHLPPPVGPTGLIDRQEAELQAKETTATALGQVRALSNC